MKIKELLEKSLYLSLKDRNFDRLPDDPTTELTKFLPDLNAFLASVGKKNPAFSHSKFSTNDLKTDAENNVKYADLQEDPFLTIFRAEFLYSGGSCSITLQPLGMTDFFSNSPLRTLTTFPAFYNYNVFSGKLYIAPKPSISGDIVVYGKKKIGEGKTGKFSSIEDDFPEWISDSFLAYLEYAFARYLCSQYNVPWQAQKEEMLKGYARIVDSENNIIYQQRSTADFSSLLPIRNTRIGL